MRVTGRGYGVLVAGVLLLGAGFFFGYPELAVIGCAGVVAVLGALAFVAWRPRLVVDRVADPDRVMRGESSTMTLSIRNASRFFGASLVARDRVVPGRREAAARLAGAVAVPLVRLRPGRTTTVSYPVPTKRRGLIQIGPLEVSRRDPLGLVSVVRQYGDAVTVWVRPRVHPITAVPVGLSRSMDGRVDRVPQGSITFATLREYVVGDDLRHVHWRTSARVGSLMVREHVDTSLPRLVVLLDDRASAHVPGRESDPVAGDGRDGEPEGTFEAACEAAASVLVAAAREDIAVELRLVSGASAAGRSEIDIGPLLDLLAEADPVTEADLRAGADLRSGTDERSEADLTADADKKRARASGAKAKRGPTGRSDSGRSDSSRSDSGPTQLGRDLHSAIESLRVRRMGDTLIYLAGPPDEEALGLVASLRGAYPSIIAGVFGPVESGLATTAGLLVVSAADGPDFAGAWDGIRAW